MSLPESRNTTYTTGSQLLSDDLNAIQDEIVRMNGLTGWLNWQAVPIKDRNPNVTGGNALTSMAFVPGSSGATPALAVDLGGKAMATIDGLSWKQLGDTLVTVHPSTPKNLFWSNVFLGYIIGDGGSGAGSRIATSPTGATWTARTDPAAHAAHNAFAESDTTIVCAREAAGFITSTNGTTWTERTHPATNKQVNGVAYGNGIFVAVNDVGRKLTSPDGITWTDRGDPNSVLSGADVIFHAGLFIALARGLKCVEVSSDGINWTKRSTSSIGMSGTPTTLLSDGVSIYAYDGAHYGGSNGVVELARSRDLGVTWTVQTFTTIINGDPDYRGVFYGRGRLWIVGADEAGEPLALMGNRQTL